MAYVKAKTKITRTTTKADRYAEEMGLRATGVKNINIFNAMILFRNFSGEKREVNGKIVNEAGKRNFCVIIPDDIAEDLQEEGWNIRISRPRDDGDAARYFLPIELNFNYKEPPIVTTICNDNCTTLDEESVGELDFADIEKAAVFIRPRVWDGRIKAYLEKLEVVVRYDELDEELRRWREEEE